MTEGQLLPVELTVGQGRALRHVSEVAKAREPQAVERIQRVFASAGIEAAPEELIEGVRRVGRVTLNFHPDRLVSNGESVAEAFLNKGIYRNQFETRISSGGLTAYPGGDRDEWERRLFDGAYHGDGVRDTERPKYGGLNLLNHPDGACPRFGSCYLRLKKETLWRATYSFGDSVDHPEDVGTINAFSSVLAAMVEGAHRQNDVLGCSGMGVPDLVEYLRFAEPHFSASVAEKDCVHALDDYIEAQVHGPVELVRDVEVLVVDPSFNCTPTGENLERAAAQFGFELDWHRGFEIDPTDISPDFRTEDVPPLAQRVVDEYSDTGHLDAAVIGRAARSVVTEFDSWTEWETERNALQHIKYIWHALVKFGRPSTR